MLKRYYFVGRYLISPNCKQMEQMYMHSQAAFKVSAFKVSPSSTHVPDCFAKKMLLL